MRGNITRRGKHSWRLKFDLDRDSSGERRIRYATVKGTRKDAQEELTRLMSEADKGTLISTSKATVANYLRSWLDNRHDLTPGSIERYRDMIERQTIPFIGAIELQKLKPMDIRDWMAALRKSGRAGKLSAQSIVLAYRVLRAALQEAVKLELLARNVCDSVSPPKRAGSEVEILDADQIATVLAAIKGYRLYPIAALAIATGMRRGELLALQWRDVDLERGVLSVERSLEQTGEGLRFKGPKSRHGKREISLPPSAVEGLRQHRRQQLELRLQLGMGKPADDTLVFSDHEGKLISPNNLSTWWRRAIAKVPNIPHVRFHALRHSHASALIAAGVDVVKVSRRLGHGSATITLNVYAHLFNKTDDDAANAIEAALGGKL